MKLQPKSHEVTETLRFILNRDKIVVEVENTESRFAWRMSVNGDWSEWTMHYQGILVHKGYGLTTAYYEGVLKDFHPFKIHYAHKGE